MSLASWQAAIGEIPDIIASEPTENRALLFAALCIIEDRFMDQAIQPSSKPEAAVDYITTEDGKTPCTPLDYAEEELSGAEEYHAMWLESEDEEYEEMARDELRHADFWIKKAKGKGQDASKIQTWYDSLKAKMV